MSDAQLYFIRDENVFLLANKWFEERSIAELPENNHEYIIASLEDRFQELVEKVNEVKSDFDAATDKIKLAGKIVRTKSYLCTAKAIGDYTTLLTVLDTMEAEIKIDVEKAIAQKEALCLAAEELLTAAEWKDATEKLRQLQAEFKALPSVPDLKKPKMPSLKGNKLVSKTSNSICLITFQRKLTSAKKQNPCSIQQNGKKQPMPISPSMKSGRKLGWCPNIVSKNCGLDSAQQRISSLQKRKNTSVILWLNRRRI